MKTKQVLACFILCHLDLVTDRDNLSQKLCLDKKSEPCSDFQHENQTLNISLIFYKKSLIKN